MAGRSRTREGKLAGTLSRPPVLVWFASAYGPSLAIPMLIGTIRGLISFILAVSCGPETKGKVLVADLVVN